MGKEINGLGKRNNMTAVEQHKMVERLKQVTIKMSPDERRHYEMIAKRDKDDEDLDSFARTRLQEMYGKYFPKHTKDDIEHAWKKMSSEHQGEESI